VSTTTQIVISKGEQEGIPGTTQEYHHIASHSWHHRTEAEEAIEKKLKKSSKDATEAIDTKQHELNNFTVIDHHNWGNKNQSSTSRSRVQIMSIDQQNAKAARVCYLRMG
jgi:hypothetical protein